MERRGKVIKSPRPTLTDKEASAVNERRRTAPDSKTPYGKHLWGENVRYKHDPEYIYEDDTDWIIDKDDVKTRDNTFANRGLGVTPIPNHVVKSSKSKLRKYVCQRMCRQNYGIKSYRERLCNRFCPSD